MPIDERRATRRGLFSRRPVAVKAPRPATRAISAAVLGVALQTTGLPAAHAQASPAVARQTYGIPAGPLAPALRSLASSANLLLTFTESQTAGKTTAGIDGPYTPQAALAALLAGTGLQAVPLEGGGYVLRAAPPVPAATVGGEAVLPTVKVQARQEADDGTTEGTGWYATRVTGAATRMNLSLRETPQSVSVVTRQQIDDQNLVMLNDVLRQTPGIVVDKLDERVTFASRGFALNTMIDGVPTFSFKNPAAEIGMVNTVIYDRVEIVRGAAGLLNGVGEPGGSLNLVRKRPAAEFAGHATVGAGSWNNYSGELDVGGPLNAAGTLRARAVASRTAGDSFIDNKKRSDDVLYAIVEADIASGTTLSAGYEHQKTAIDGANFGQIPLFFSDGSRTRFARSFNPGTPWSQWDMYTNKVFVTLDHAFDNGWKLKLDASRLRNERKALFGYLFEYFPVDASTGDSTIEIRQNPSDATSKSFDLYAAGPFQAFGREHQAALGLSVNDYKGTVHLNSANPAGWDRRPLNFYELQSFAAPSTFYTFFDTYSVVKETALYGSTRLKIADPLAVVLGARATWYDEKSSAYNGPADTWTTNPSAKESGVFTPYAGVVVDLSREVSAYASYSRIFMPNTVRDRSNAMLAPQTGQSYEAGLKGEHLGGRLQTSFAVFKTQENNVAVEDDGGELLPDGSTPYRAVRGARSKGFELTAAGEVARSLQVMGGYTYFVKRDRDGEALLPSYPQRLLRVAASYRLPGAWSRLTVGGSVSYQSGINYDEIDGLGRASQGGVALLGLMARYDISRQWSASLNVENLTDKRYYSGLGGYNGYNEGTPRNFWLKMRYKF